MNLLGNLIWLIFGGLWSAIGYIIGGFALCVTIIGIPWGLQCFKLARVVLWPFGTKIVPGKSPDGCLALFCNIVWLIFGGLPGDPARHFYLLVLPLIWVAVRTGMVGVTVALGIVQLGVA